MARGNLPQSHPNANSLPLLIKHSPSTPPCLIPFLSQSTLSRSPCKTAEASTACSMGNRAQTEGSPSRVKNATDHHAQAFFFLFLSRLSPARKAEPRSPHHQPPTPGTGEITLYLLSHKVTVKVWWRASTRQLRRDAGDPEIPPAPRLSPPG
ncbi:unnamed protein product [Pleuronectes platessa]|uniref:Uncharacterized protein n=1 Tax=Pleuronectes platessa TaxID=8262 RepID=A0A9N7UI50_PLEPL|nr:unnamed protein product [Pleuronectes platessa]